MITDEQSRWAVEAQSMRLVQPRLSSGPPIPGVAGQRAARNRHQRAIGLNSPHAVITGVAQVDRTIRGYSEPIWRVKLSMNRQ